MITPALPSHWAGSYHISLTYFIKRSYIIFALKIYLIFDQSLIYNPSLE